MAGGNLKGKPSSSSASHHRKSRWESGNKSSSDHKSTGGATASAPTPTSKEDCSSKSGPSKPLPDPGPPFPINELGEGSGPLPFADPAGFGPPPPPAYGFHKLERRTIFLADGSVRSYFALPPDYQDFPPPQGRPGSMDPPERFLPFGGPVGREPDQGRLRFDRHFPPVGPLSPEGLRRDREELFLQHDYWNSLGLDRRGPIPSEGGAMKRKYGDDRDGRDIRDDFARQKQQLLQYGNSSLNPNGFPGDRPLGERGPFFGGPSSPFGRDMMEGERGRDMLEGGRGVDDEMRARKQMRYDLSGDHGGGDHGGGDFGIKQPDVDPQSLKRAFLHFVKLINENASQRKTYLEDSKAGPLQCLACPRAPKDYPDMHGLLLHAYSSHSPDLHVDHLGFHKALCVLMGWNYNKVPDNSKAYRSLSADQAEANKEDLILWPPVVIINNTNTGRGKEGRMEGMGNKVMDNKLKDLGFGGGKSKSLYGKDGHQGITLVKFVGDKSGLKEATRLVDYFEKDKHGRKGWTHAQSTKSGRDDDSNPNLVKVDEKMGKTRILYGYLASASDLEKVDFETRKRANIESRKELKASI